MKNLFTLPTMFILLFSLNIDPIISQVEWKYIRHNNNPDNTDESTLAFVSAVELSNGNTLCGGINAAYPNFNPFLSILDQNGKVLHDSIFLKADQLVFHVQEIPNTNKFIALSTGIEPIRILKTIYDFDFNKISEEKVFDYNQYDSYDFIFNKTILSNGNTLITTPVVASEDGLLYIIINPNGEVIKHDIILAFGTNYKIIESIDQSKYYLAGEGIIELDTNLQFVKTIIDELPREDDSYGFGIVKFNNHYVVCSNFYENGQVVTIYDENFEPLKYIIEPEDTVNTYIYEGTFLNSTINQNDSFLITSFTRYDEQFENSKMFIRKYDKSYRLVWETVLTDPIYDFGMTNLELNKDGSIIITLYGGEKLSDEDIIHTGVIRLGSNGLVSKTKDSSNSTINFTVYPNPSFGEFNIVNQQFLGSVSEIAFFDVNGNLKFKSNVKNSDINNLDLSQLPSGLYMYQLTNDKYIISSGKWVKF